MMSVAQECVPVQPNIEQGPDLWDDLVAQSLRRKPNFTARGAEQLAAAKAEGMALGRLGIRGVEWSSTFALQFAFSQGNDIGYQSYAREVGYRRGLTGRSDELPIWIDPDFAAEHQTGWDKGHDLFLAQCRALDELGLEAKVVAEPAAPRSTPIPQGRPARGYHALPMGDLN